MTESLTELQPPASNPPALYEVDIIAGDWNSVEKPQLDRDGGSRSPSRDIKDMRVIIF